MKLNVFTPLKIVLSIAGRWGVWGRGLRRVSCSQMRLSKAKPMVGPGHSHPREPTTVKIVLSVLTHVSLKEGRAQSDFTLCSDCSAGGWRQEGGGSPAEHSQAARPAGRSPGLPDSTGTSLSGQSLALTFISSNLPESILPSLDIQLTKRRF